jgi:hypothetical protein
MVRDRGFEPLTPSVSRKCSTTELTAPPMADQTGRGQYALAREFSPTISPAAHLRPYPDGGPTRTGQWYQRDRRLESLGYCRMSLRDILSLLAAV